MGALIGIGLLAGALAGTPRRIQMSAAFSPDPPEPVRRLDEAR